MARKDKYQFTGTRWFKTDAVYAQHLSIDTKNSVIRNVSVCTAGEAKGHGVHLEDEFISEVVRLGNAFSQGVKCRFGHPNMSAEALGTYLGRFKSFRVVGSKAVADLYLDKIAEKAPGGNLYEYVLAMAANNPDMFGASICFDVDGYYHYDENNVRVEGQGEKTYVRISELFGTDIVDEPAANADGLFSAAFNIDKFAVAATEFLDQNPLVWKFLEDHPEKFQPFLKKYAAYKNSLTQTNMKRKPKGFFGRLAAALVSQEQYNTIDTSVTTGENIRIVAAGDEPAPEDEVYVVQEDASEMPLPDGDHTIASGDFEGLVISVTDGKITATTTPDSTEPATTGEQNPPMGNSTPDSELSALKKEIARLKKSESNAREGERRAKEELDRYKKNPLEPHTDITAADDPVDVNGAAGDDQFWSKPWNARHRKVKSVQ